VVGLTLISTKVVSLRDTLK